MAVNSSVKSGDLRHVVTFLGPTLGTDGAGAVVSYTPVFANVRAAVEPMRAIDVIRSGQTISQVITLITIRWMPGIANNMRIQHGADTYVIQAGVDPDLRRRKLVITCLLLAQNL